MIQPSIPYIIAPPIHRLYCCFYYITIIISIVIVLVPAWAILIIASAFILLFIIIGICVCRKLIKKNQGKDGKGAKNAGFMKGMCQRR